MPKPIKRGLNRGLDSLLSDQAKSLAEQVKATLNTVATSRVPDEIRNGELYQIALDHLQAGQYQPRQNFDQESLQELADSISLQGIIEPIIARESGGQSYEIIAGERRWRAARLAGLTTIPVIVRNLTDKAALAVALVENLQRQDLNVLEQAIGLQRLIEEFNLSQEQIGHMIGKHRTTVSNLLRLLKLNPEVKALLQAGLLEMGHARALLSLNSRQQIQTAKKITEKKLSVRETEQLIKQLLAGHSTLFIAKNNTYVDPDVQRLQASLAEKLGTRVLITHNKDGKGKLEIHYHSLDALDGILAHID